MMAALASSQWPCTELCQSKQPKNIGCNSGIIISQQELRDFLPEGGRSSDSFWRTWLEVRGRYDIEKTGFTCMIKVSSYQRTACLSLNGYSLWRQLSGRLAISTTFSYERTRSLSFSSSVVALQGRSQTSENKMKDPSRWWKLIQEWQLNEISFYFYCFILPCVWHIPGYARERRITDTCQRIFSQNELNLSFYSLLLCPVTCCWLINSPDPMIRTSSVQRDEAAEAFSCEIRILIVYYSSSIPWLQSLNIDFFPVEIL